MYQVSDYGETISTYKVRTCSWFILVLEQNGIVLTPMGLMQILDTHSDHSGSSASSHDQSDTTTKDDASNDAQSQASKQADDVSRLEEAGQADDRERRSRRQGASAHKKIDEVILVGAGALS